MSAPQWMTKPLTEAEGSPGEVDIRKMEDLIESLQDAVKGMESSLKKYEGDPRKYLPQLDNVKTYAMRIGGYSRAILRELGEKV